MPPSPNDIEALVAEIHDSPKYRNVCPAFIRSLGTQELQKRPSFKEAVKATRNKLHQVGGAYFEHPIRYAQWLTELQQAAQNDDPDTALRQICVRLMAQHASTRERLPILEHFYARTLAEIAPVHSILDIACGLNPLAIPWMPLAAGAAYYAIDI